MRLAGQTVIPPIKRDDAILDDTTDLFPANLTFTASGDYLRGALTVMVILFLNWPALLDPLEPRCRVVRKLERLTVLFIAVQRLLGLRVELPLANRAGFVSHDQPAGRTELGMVSYFNNLA